jgi:hypothetical protein
MGHIATSAQHGGTVTQPEYSDGGNEEGFSAFEQSAAFVDQGGKRPIAVFCSEVYSAGIYCPLVVSDAREPYLA